MSENHAETLRRAAKLMRERAKAATPGPWEPRENCAVVNLQLDPSGQFDDDFGYVLEECEAGQEDADYIASMHPLIALAIADWLDETAVAYGTFPDSVPGHSLAIALEYLGKTT